MSAIISSNSGWNSYSTDKSSVCKYEVLQIDSKSKNSKTIKRENNQDDQNMGIASHKTSREVQILENNKNEHI